MNTEYFTERIVCPLCADERSGQVITELPMSGDLVGEWIREYYSGRVPKEILIGTNYTVMYCALCDFYWHRYILNDYWMGDLYSNWIDSHESLDKQISKGVAHRAKIAETLALQLGAVSPPVGGVFVLDWGGGWGSWSMAAIALGCNAYLVDLAPQRQQYGEERGIHWASSLADLADVRFTLVNAAEVLEHVSDPLASLKELAGLLEPGGGVTISVPDADENRDPGRYVRKGPYQPLEHINGFTRKSIRRLVEAADMKIVRHKMAPLPGDLRSFLRTLTYNAVLPIIPHGMLPFTTKSVLAIRSL